MYIYGFHHDDQYGEERKEEMEKEMKGQKKKWRKKRNKWSKIGRKEEREGTIKEETKK